MFTRGDLGCGEGWEEGMKGRGGGVGREGDMEGSIGQDGMGEGGR